LIAGWDRGRIWRVLYDPRESARVLPQPVPRWDFGRLNTSESLVTELSSLNAWRRQTAQRLLIERGERSVAPALSRLLEQGVTPVGRLHALRTLEGLKALEPGTLLAALGDASPGVRRHALELSEAWLNREPALFAKVLAMTEDPDPKVRIQLAFTLGEPRIAGHTAYAPLAFARLPGRWQQALRAYAAGVDAWREANPEAVARRFRPLGIQPEPWTPADCLLAARGILSLGSPFNAGPIEEYHRFGDLVAQVGEAEAARRSAMAIDDTVAIVLESEMARDPEAYARLKQRPRMPGFNLRSAGGAVEPRRSKSPVPVCCGFGSVRALRESPMNDRQ